MMFLVQTINNLLFRSTGACCRRCGALAVVVLVGLCCSAIAQTSSAIERPAPWHLPEWRYRQEIHLLALDTTGKINTAEAVMQTWPDDLAKDGRDIRMMSAAGKPVPCRLVDRNGEDIKGVLPENEPLRVRFHITNQEQRQYYIYFGNPKAVAAWGAWSEQLGALVLETWEHPKRKVAQGFRHLTRMLTASKKKFGSDHRRQINDPENPFGRDDFYISIYRGLIFCPVDGVYRFGTDSDDSSYLLINRQLVVSRNGGHNPDDAFNDSGQRELGAGIHAIEYYHVQAAGGALASAGWQPPGSSRIVLIPEDAFVRTLPTALRLFEDQQSVLAMFFESSIKTAFQLGRNGPFVADVVFKDRSRSSVSEIVIRHWDFGEGEVSTEQNPTKTLMGPRARTVTLRCVDALGNEMSISRRIQLDVLGTQRVNLTMEMSVERSLLRKGEPVCVTVKCNNATVDMLKMELVGTLSLPGGSVIATWREPVVLSREKWQEVKFKIARADKLLFDVGKLEFWLEYRGHPIASRTLTVRRANDVGLRLTVHNGKVIDAEGAQVLVRLSETPYIYRHGERFARKVARGGSLTVLFVDDALAGHTANSHINLFMAQLRTAFPQAKLKAVRIGHTEGTALSSLGFRKALDTAASVRSLEPDLVVLGGALRDVIRFESAARYEAKLRLLLDRVEAAGRPDVVFLAPPPTMSNANFGQRYAIAVKRIGLLRKIPVVDAYSAFLTATPSGRGKNGQPVASTTHWHRFYRDQDSTRPVYHLAPTREGQKVIATFLWKTLFPKRAMPPFPAQERTSGAR